MTTPPRRRAVFLDVDGTYAHHGVVPAEHVAAARAARAAGSLVLLCTGRPISMLPPRILAAGFDGVVASAGGYVTLDGEVLADVRFPAPLAARTVAVLDGHAPAYLLESPDAVRGPVGVDRRLTELLAPWLDAERRSGPSDILDALVMTADLADASFGKVTVFDSPVPVTHLAEEIGPEVAALPSSIPGMGDSAGELYLARVTKAVGIEVVVDRLGLDRADVIAVGDGVNDLEMLAYAGLGVAIEGADPRVLAVADRTAPPPDRHGLATLFAELGLLG